MTEHTILDPYGTPYGGARDNHDEPIRIGGSSYESPSYGAIRPSSTYADQLHYRDENNTGGRA